MHPTARSIIAQIVRPEGGAPPEPVIAASTQMTIEQIVSPKGSYSGEERRAQGALIAEVVSVPQVGGPAAQEI